MPNLGAVRRERFLTIDFLTIDNPLNPPGVGQFFFKARLSIRTCVPNLGAVRSDGHRTDSGRTDEQKYGRTDERRV